MGYWVFPLADQSVRYFVPGFRGLNFPNLRYCPGMAAGNEQTIEVEVVEIDGVAVEPRPARREKPNARGRIDWTTWQGHVRRLDARWWPLWLVLGFIVLVLALAVGICVAVVFVVWRIFKGLLKGIASLLTPHR